MGPAALTGVNPAGRRPADACAQSKVMTLDALCLGVAALLLVPEGGIAAPRDRSPEFVVPDGLAVTLWAESPRFFKPTNMDADSRGHVWVAANP